MPRGVVRIREPMNQTRNFLLFALLAVGYFLFMAWEKDYMAPPPAPAAAASKRVTASSSITSPAAESATTAVAAT